METNTVPDPIDLTKFLHRMLKSLRRLWLLVLSLTLLLSCTNFIRARHSYVPIYESKAIFSVDSGYYSKDVFTSSFYYDYTAAQQVAETFPYLLGTDFMKDLILAQLGTQTINGSISAASIAETNMFEIRVTSNDPEDAYDVLQAVIACYPKVAVYMFDNSELIIRESPTVPTAPINPFSASRAVLNGAAVGLLIGLAVAALLALMNQTVASVDDLKEIINLPIFAAFPTVTVKKRRKDRRRFVNTRDDPALSEAIRGLRTKVRKQLEDTGGQIVLLTSTIPGEGKTTAATNLALSLAAEGHSTVLVDADLRNQTIARIFRTSNKNNGLMDCLRNPTLPAANCLKQAPGSNLMYISGRSTKKRHYSLEARAIQRVLGELRSQFRYIIIDTPPCSVVSDTALLCRYADCVLYVVKQDYANHAQIIDAITSLHQRDIPLAGCVANGVPRRHRRYGYGYGASKKYGQSKK